VLLISVDTLRPDFLGAYDPAREGTPSIDRLASGGVVFEDVLAQGASTAISHKSIFYSLYPAVHKTTIRTVPQESLTSPVQALVAAGLTSAAFVDGGQLDPKYGIGRGFGLYDSHGEGERDLDRLAEVAEAWLDENDEKPFFLFLHTYQTHAPYDPPPEYRERFAGWYEGEIDPEGRRGKNFYNKTDLSEDDLRFVRSLYEAEVAYVDDFIGRVLADLEDRGLADTTLVILLSDHGESLGEEGYVGHNQLETVQLRIPLIVRAPGVESGRIAEPVEAIDVMPTIFSALGVAPPYDFQGIDLLPTLLGRAELPAERTRIAQQGMRVIVEDSSWRWWFDLAGKAPERLVHFGPEGEVANTAPSEDWPEEGQRLKRVFREMVQESRPLAAAFTIESDVDPTEDAELRKQLEALGYLQ